MPIFLADPPMDPHCARVHCLEEAKLPTRFKPLSKDIWFCIPHGVEALRSDEEYYVIPAMLTTMELGKGKNYYYHINPKRMPAPCWWIHCYICGDHVEGESYGYPDKTGEYIHRSCDPMSPEYNTKPQYSTTQNQ